MPRRVLKFLLVIPLLLAASGAAVPASVTAGNGAPYSFSWAGTPTSPQPWNPATGFDVVVHDRDFTQTYNNPYPFAAQHGTDCGAFQGFGVGGIHTVSTYADEVFMCNNHMMTGVNGQGYGEVAFTPAQLLDWSAGPVSVTWQVDTLRTSCRDWLSFNVMPFADNLMLTDGVGVDLFNEPKNELLFTTGASCPMAYSGQDIRNFAAADIPGPGGAVEDVVDTGSPLAAKNRQTFEIDISSTHVRFGMPAFNKWFVDGNLQSPLPYQQAVIQFEQHSYTPDKECNPTTTFCASNTWHWSNINISNGVPFTILRADRFQVAGGHTGDGVPDTVNLPAATPANSFVRFEALSASGSVRFSVDGGASWITPTHQQLSQNAPTGGLTDGQTCLYWWPIPAGATQIKFQAADPYWSWNAIRNISVWSQAPGSGVTNNPPPAPTPTPAPTPVATPTPAPTPTPVVAPEPSPSASPAGIVGGHRHPRPTPKPKSDALSSAPEAVEAALDLSSAPDLVANATHRAASWQGLLVAWLLASLAGAAVLLRMRVVEARRRPKQRRS